MTRAASRLAAAACATVASIAQASQSCATGAAGAAGGYAPSSPTSRFVDNADGTVTDAASRLMWMRCSAGQAWVASACSGAAAPKSWQAADAEAAKINRSGAFFYSDWRLPRLNELATITERECQDPRVNLAVFPGTPAAAYWTATSRTPDGADASAFVLGFGSSGVAYEDKVAPHLVRLVRDAR